MGINLCSAKRDPLLAMYDVMVLLRFDLLTFSNPDGDRYLWDPINKILHGPFGANVLAVGNINGIDFANFFEGWTETTGFTETIHGNWATLGGASTAADQTTAPDSNKLADKLTFGAAAGDGIEIALGSATDDTDQTEAPWVWTESGTHTFRIQFLLKDGTTATSGDFTATTTPQRFDFTADILAGGTAPKVRILNGTAGAAGSVYIWGAPCYKDCPYPLSYRTNDTGADQVQAPDVGFWAAAVVPAAMLSGKWGIKGIPFWTHLEAGAGTAWRYLCHAVGLPDRIYFDSTSNKEDVEDNGVGAVSSNALTIDRYSIIERILNAPAGKITISGAASGNGPVTGAPWEWDTGNNIYCGSRNNGTAQFKGLISEPRAA